MIILSAFNKEDILKVTVVQNVFDTLNKFYWKKIHELQKG